MAEKHIANVEAQWKAVCTTPDVCKVGKKPVPFDSYRDLSNELKASPNVYARGTHVYRLTDWVRGTDGNAGKGVVSQTSQQPGHVRLVGDDTRVKVNGLVCARHDTVVEMNVGPGGPNTVGKLVTSQGAPAGVVETASCPAMTRQRRPRSWKSCRGTRRSWASWTRTDWTSTFSSVNSTRWRTGASPRST